MHAFLRSFKGFNIDITIHGTSGHPDNQKSSIKMKYRANQKYGSTKISKSWLL